MGGVNKGQFERLVFGVGIDLPAWFLTGGRVKACDTYQWNSRFASRHTTTAPSARRSGSTTRGAKVS